MTLADSLGSIRFMDRDSIIMEFKRFRTDRAWNLAVADQYAEDGRKASRPWQHAMRNVYLIDWPEMAVTRDENDFPEFDHYEDFMSFRLTYL